MLAEVERKGLAMPVLDASSYGSLVGYLFYYSILLVAGLSFIHIQYLGFYYIFY